MDAIGSWAANLVGGSMLAAVPVALLAGVVSFFSPCVVPLLPGYVSYATGMSAADVVDGQGRRHRGKMLAGMVLFVVGFAAVFVAGAALIGGVGGTLIGWQKPITKIMGGVIIVLGGIFAGLVPFGRRDLRLRWVPRIGVAAAPLLGVVFALGWTPCIGPTLGVVYTLALNEGTAAKGAVLAAVYAVGLGVPFVVAGLAFGRMNRTVKVLRRHQQWVMRLGGVLMITVGVLMISGLWDVLIGAMRQWVSGFATVL